MSELPPTPPASTGPPPVPDNPRESAGGLRPPETQIADLRALLDISRSIGYEKNLDRLLNLIMDECTRLLDADRSSLFLYDEDQDEIFTRIAQRAEVKEIRLPVGRGISGSVARARAMENIADAYDDERFDRSWDAKTGYRTRSVLCAPIETREGRLVGVIQVLNKHAPEAEDGVGVFDVYDEYLLGAFCSHAAHALENARLNEAYLDGQKLRKAMEVAGDIQRSLLPAADPEFAGFDIAGYSAACDDAGGDYFDFFPASGGRLAVAVGDVTGHGIGAALLMATGRALLRAFVTGTSDLARSFHLLNDALEQDMEDDRFMTLLCGFLDSEARTFAYTSAGHDEPLVLRAGQEEFQSLEATGLPLGMMPDQEFPLAAPVALNEGDVLVLATDGVWEAVNPAEEEYGHQRLMDVVLKARNLPASEIVDRVYYDVERYCAGEPLRDDFTLIIVCVRA